MLLTRRSLERARGRKITIVKADEVPLFSVKRQLVPPTTSPYRGREGGGVGGGSGREKRRRRRRR